MTLRRIQKLNNQKMIRVIAVLMLLMMPFSLSAAQVVNIRSGDHPDKSRLVIEMTGEMDFRATILDRPKRLVIHIPAKNWSVQGGVVLTKPFRSTSHTTSVGNLMVLSFPLDSPHVIQSAFMMPGTPNRLVVDMVPANAIEFKQNLDVVHGPLRVIEERESLDSVISNIMGDATTPVPVSKPVKRKKPIIVIDAGHGGKDPGAISKSGIQEKQITLPMAKRIAAMLNATGRYDARLTRTKDHFIKLYNRVKIAQRAKADLFISIHADSVGNRKTKGASVYTLSNKASDVQSAKLAARENQADLIGGMDLDVEDEDVSAILIDLSMRESMNQSKKLANKVISNFRGVGVKTLRGPHRYAGFAVLKAPDIPSILIETGFVSNESEARKLLKPEHQKRIGRAILKSLDRYFGF